MKIDSINITSTGYVDCKSKFYSASDILNGSNYNFNIGINLLTGEIDSGIWAVSYLLSMYKHRTKDFVLFDNYTVVINGEEISLNELEKFTCYMDTIHPLFSSKLSVKKLVEQGLRKIKLDFSTEDVKSIFDLNDQRFERPISCVGNEVFRAMAAIAFAHGKQIFCFPWLSQLRFESFHNNLEELLNILVKLNMVVVLPKGQSRKTGDGSLC